MLAVTVCPIFSDDATCMPLTMPLLQKTKGVAAKLVTVRVASTVVAFGPRYATKLIGRKFSLWSKANTHTTSWVSIDPRKNALRDTVYAAEKCCVSVQRLHRFR